MSHKKLLPFAGDQTHVKKRLSSVSHLDFASISHLQRCFRTNLAKVYKFLEKTADFKEN